MKITGSRLRAIIREEVSSALVEASDPKRSAAIQSAIDSIERQFGKGAIMTADQMAASSADYDRRAAARREAEQKREEERLARIEAMPPTVAPDEPEEAEGVMTEPGFRDMGGGLRRITGILIKQPNGAENSPDVYLDVLTTAQPHQTIPVKGPGEYIMWDYHKKEKVPFNISDAEFRDMMSKGAMAEEVFMTGRSPDHYKTKVPVLKQEWRDADGGLRQDLRHQFNRVGWHFRYHDFMPTLPNVQSRMGKQRLEKISKMDLI